jgi:hypothetical protein
VERKGGWIAPLGVLVTIVTTFCTVQFQKFFFSADFWQAVFIIAGLFSLAWLGKAIYQASGSASLDDVVNDIKRSAVKEATSSLAASQMVDVATSRVGGNIVIHRAVYGAKDVEVDVTEAVRQRMAGDRIEMIVTNENLGGDPIKGLNKSLLVEFSISGKRGQVRVFEGQVLLLPLPA